MYESDGSIMVYWHALDSPETPTGNLTYEHVFHTIKHAYLNYLHENVTILHYAL